MLFEPSVLTGVKYFFHAMNCYPFSLFPPAAIKSLVRLVLSEVSRVACRSNANCLFNSCSSFVKISTGSFDFIGTAVEAGLGALSYADFSAFAFSSAAFAFSAFSFSKVGAGCGVLLLAGVVGDAGGTPHDGGKVPCACCGMPQHGGQ